MKKTFTLLASVAFAATAFAAVPEQAQAPAEIVSKNAALQTVKVTANKVNENLRVKAISPSVLTEGTSSLNAHVYGPYETSFTVGISPDFQGYRSAFSITPGAGNLNFYNLTAGATAQTWEYTLNDEESSSSSASVLSLKSIPTYSYSGINMTVTDGTSTAVWEPMSVNYFCGGSLYFWGFESTCGLTTYPGTYDGGTTVGYMTYDITGTETYYNASNGLFTAWPEVLSLVQGTEESSISDVKLVSFGQYIAKQASPYLLSGLWMLTSASFSEDTELYVNIYPVENGIINDEAPIAKGTCTAAAGDFQGMLQYTVLPVDEDGDELDEDLVVDSAIFISFEGLTENESVKKFQPIYGSGTTFPVDVNRSDAFFNNSYIKLSYKLDGEEKTHLGTCPYDYYEDEEHTTLFGPCNYYLMLDMSFPFVQDVNNVENTSRYFVVDVPTDGGTVELDLYGCYNIAGLIEGGYLTEEVTNGDWFDCELTNFDSENFVATFSITGAKLDGTEGRNGIVKYTGMAMDFTIEVVQGMESGIQGVTAAAAEGAVEYFDLQGRKLNAAPANGFFFQRQGNKVTKVIR